jgi:hypothetical protein
MIIIIFFKVVFIFFSDLILYYWAFPVTKMTPANKEQSSLNPSTPYPMVFLKTSIVSLENLLFSFLPGGF